MEHQADHITFQGASHTKCDDYSLVINFPSGEKGLVVCDGCSGSPMSDIGSRILACSAMKEMIKCNQLIQNQNNVVIRHQPESFSHFVLTPALEAIDVLGIDQSTLASTLLVCFPINPGVYKILVYGDGVVFFRDRETQQLHFQQINFESNAPYYQIYDLDPESYIDFLFQQAHSVNPYNEKTITDENGNKRIVDLLTPYELVLTTEKVDLIGLASDGIESFTDSITTLPTSDVLKEFTALKGTYGEFVKRRINKATKSYSKQGFAPYDDVSVAMICFGEGNI